MTIQNLHWRGVSVSSNEVGIFKAWFSARLVIRSYVVAGNAGPWDFSSFDMRQTAGNTFDEDRVHLSVVRPMRGRFGQIQGLHYSTVPLEKVEKKFGNAMAHVAFPSGCPFFSRRPGFPALGI